MDEDIRAQIWQLCQYLQSARLTMLSNEELTALFQQVFALSVVMQNVEAEPLEHQVVERCFAEVTAEIRRRGLTIRCLPVEVVISKEGKFLKGLDELRFTFSILSFDEMMRFIDTVFEKPLNDAQRKALLQLAYEKVYADEEAN